MNIVLAHGILGFNKLFDVIDYFNGVKAHLEKDIKIKVLVTEVSPVDGIIKRGDALSEQITDALNAGLPNGLDAGQKTHIIAHSMGGLDSRYILSPCNKNNIAKRITSLTTIGTPHNGSPVADLIFSVVDGTAPLPGLKDLENNVRDRINEMVVSLDGLRDLTTRRCAAINRLYVDHPEVRYFSVAGIGRKISLTGFNLAPTCQLLLATHGYLKLKTGEKNDGAVTVSSAERYEPITEQWPTDHFEEVGHNIDRGPFGKPNGFDYLAKYAEIVSRLSQI